MSSDLFPEILTGAGGRYEADLDTTMSRLTSEEGESTHQLEPYDGVRSMDHAYPPERRDLARLYSLVRSRRVMTVLEFGVGYSTAVLADALRRNRLEYDSFVSANLRRTDAWKLLSVDDSADWVETAKSRIPREWSAYTEIHLSQVQMTTFGGRICTEYVILPNVCPDLIYLDAPSQGLALGDINGISTRHLDRVPMACDILKIEHFLLPGTLIVVDGRTANVRFLIANLQRNWWHHHDVEGDVHFLELRERPLGRWNAAQIAFCLGERWLATVD